MRASTASISPSSIAEAADLHLVVQPPQVLERARRPASAPGRRSGTCAPARLPAERVGHEPLGRQPGPAEVAARQPAPPMHSSPATPTAAVAPAVEHVDLRVGDRPPDRDRRRRHRSTRSTVDQTVVSVGPYRFQSSAPRASSARPARAATPRRRTAPAARPGPPARLEQQPPGRRRRLHAPSPRGAEQLRQRPAVGRRSREASTTARPPSSGRRAPARRCRTKRRHGHQTVRSVEPRLLLHRAQQVGDGPVRDSPPLGARSSPTCRSRTPGPAERRPARRAEAVLLGPHWRSPCGRRAVAP